MTHSDHISLLEKVGIKEGEVWAELGSGTGAFTLALRDLGGESITIYSVDKDKQSLHIQKRNINKMFPNSNIQFIHKDFTEDLNISLLDGLLMANSFHYVKNKAQLLEQIKIYLKPLGKFVIVEYNVDKGNMWVPYPLSYSTFAQLVAHHGYSNPQLHGSIPSHFLREIYSASCIKKFNSGFFPRFLTKT